MMNAPAPEQVTHKGVEFLIDRDLKVVRFLTTGVFSEMLAALDDYVGGRLSDYLVLGTGGFFTFKEKNG